MADHRRPLHGKVIQDVGERALDGLLLEGEQGNKLLPLLILCIGHGAGAAQGCVGGLVDEPGVPGDQDRDVVGEVLGDVEALEAVDAVLYGPGGRSEVPGKCPDAHRT
ncbi:MAG: hypothetical protein ABIJ86_17185 [Spirochaetota bacterium]